MIRIGRSTCVMLAALGCLSIGDSHAAEGIGGCESIYPGALYANHAAGAKECSVQWVPGNIEHVNDFAAQCRLLTGSLYVNFVHDEMTGRATCVFKPAIWPADRMAELQGVVQSWTDSCMEKERKKERDRTSCWLTAVEALQPYAADASAPFAKEVSQLQSAWLHRARHLLTVRAQLVERLAAASHLARAPAAHGCSFDPIVDGARCTRPAHVAQVIAPGANRITEPAVKENVVDQVPKPPSASTTAGWAKAKKPNRRKNFSRIQSAAVKKAKAQSFKLSVAKVTPPHERKLRAALAKGKSPQRFGISKATPRSQALSRKHALLVKTSTTSKCLNSLEWC